MAKRVQILAKRKETTGKLIETSTAHQRFRYSITSKWIVGMIYKWGSLKATITKSSLKIHEAFFTLGLSMPKQHEWFPICWFEESSIQLSDLCMRQHYLHNLAENQKRFYQLNFYHKLILQRFSTGLVQILFYRS